MALQATLKVRLLDGAIIQHDFPADALLSVVCDHIIDYAKENCNEDLELIERYNAGIKISVPFPRKLYDSRQIKTTTILQAGLTPSASLIVESDEQNGYHKPKPNPTPTKIVPAYQLRKESQEEKDAFKEKQRLKEIEQMEREKLEKKRIVEGLRKEIESDKREREQQKLLLEEQQMKEQLKQERKRKRAPSIPTVREGKCVVNIRSLHGKTHVVDTLSEDDTLQDLHELLRQKGWLAVTDDITFVNTGTMPRKEFEESEFEDVTLADAELVPNGSISVLRASLKGVVKQGAGEMKKRRTRTAASKTVQAKRK
jgi:hypothetical protein